MLCLGRRAGNLAPWLQRYCDANGEAEAGSGGRPVLLEYCFDDGLGDWLLRSKKVVVDDGPIAVAHGKRIGHMAKAGDLLQSLLECGHDRVVALLDPIGRREKVLLRAFGVGDLAPGLIAPKSRHPLEPLLGRYLGIPPDGVPVHVHHGKVEEDIARLCSTGRFGAIGFKSLPNRG
jgi:hypothetical protein